MSEDRKWVTIEEVSDDCNKRTTMGMKLPNGVLVRTVQAWLAPNGTYHTTEALAYVPGAKLGENGKFYA